MIVWIDGWMADDCMDKEQKEEPMGRDVTKNTGGGKDTCFADPRPLALFVVMFAKAHLTPHSKMSGSN